MDKKKYKNLERLEKRQEIQSWLLTFPSLLWLSVFFLIPFIIIFLYSFFKSSILGVEYVLTLDAYREVLSFRYIHSFYNSIRLAVFTTIICLILGYPTAYFIARSPEKIKSILLMLIIIPFWTNLIIRVFAWRIFLAPHGIMNTFLLDMSLIDSPIRILRTDFAVLLVTVYVYLPYMILPLYAVIEKMDFRLLEAAKDLGAKPYKAFFKITLPLSKPGIFAGTILVFIPAIGSYIIPQLVGHQSSMYIGQVITYKVRNIPRDWPVASALSFMLILVICLLLYLFYRLNKRLSNSAENTGATSISQEAGVR